MQLVNVVVRDPRTVEAAFSVTVLGNDKPATEVVRSIIDPIIETWSREDRANHTIFTTGKTLGSQITVRLATAKEGNGVRRPAVTAAAALKVTLDQNGLSVNPSVIRSYHDLEGLADVGLPYGKPAGGVV